MLVQTPCCGAAVVPQLVLHPAVRCPTVVLHTLQFTLYLMRCMCTAVDC